LRPFGIRLPSRQGTKKFDAAAHEAVRHDPVLSASVTALLETLAAVESQIARLDERLKELARRSEVCWRLMSVPGVGPIVALAFMAAIEDVGRFHRMRDIGVYLGLTPKRHQSGETDVVLGISRQGDAMAQQLSLRGGECAAHHGATRLAAEELGSQAAQAARAEASARSGGAQARGADGPDLEGWDPLRRRASLTAEDLPRRGKRADRRTVKGSS
jgi:transposase